VDLRAEATAREVAALARLELAGDELARLAEDLARILDAFESLGRADVGAAAPLIALGGGDGALREDRPAPGLEGRDLLARAPDPSPPPNAAPGDEPAYFRVPRAIEQEPG
jgi:aspartyl/glutamyl-tRNA(Asn/Gln) amidotransferase C subunit